MTDVTIFHNPQCGASRNTLALLTDAGLAPTVVEYLKAGWTRPQLEDLLKRMGARPRDILRAKNPLAAERGLLDETVSDDALLEAMVAEPGLVERPIVITPKGVALCRPSERALALI